MLTTLRACAQQGDYGKIFKSLQEFFIFKIIKKRQEELDGVKEAQHSLEVFLCANNDLGDKTTNRAVML